jgi:predicted outer membrane repeat protein
MIYSKKKGGENMIRSKYGKRLGFLVFCLTFTLTICGAAAAAPSNTTHDTLQTNTSQATNQLNTTTITNESQGKKNLPDPSVYNSNGQFLEDFNSISAAVNYAQSNGENDDTITLAPGNYYENGITINKNMNFDVSQNGYATINGLNNWIFHIESGAIVKISRISLINGATSGVGGAIDNDGILTVKNCTFTGDTADQTGGAINNEGSLTVNNCIFKDNSVTSTDWCLGGAIYNDGTLVVNNSQFISNTAKYQGGAIGADKFFTISNSMFKNNYALVDGGAISGNDALINDCNFEDNSATGAGGAICISGSTITNCKFSGNSATGGGAIYGDGLDLKGDTFLSNLANGNTALSWMNFSQYVFGSGGGILIDGGQLNVNNCNFTGNDASNQGGAIYNGPLGSLTVAGSNFTNNRAIDDGGAIYNNDATFTVSSSKFTDNSVKLYEGGAIFNFDGSSQSKITGSTFTTNSVVGTMGHGGAIENVGGVLTINNSIFTGNEVTSGFGGAIENIVASKLTINISKFTNNTASSDGGAIYNAGTLNLNGCNLTNNKASDGGAIGNDGTANVHFNRIVSNIVTYVGESIYNDGGKVNATLNWWGSNLKSSVVKQISNNYGGTVNYNPWIVLTLSASPNTVSIYGTSTITADFLHDNNGVYHNPSSGVVPYTGDANFKTTKGTINNVKYVNGKATSKLTNLTTLGVATVTCVGQPPVTTVTVKGVHIAVISVSPNNGAVDVPVNQVITIAFSESNNLPLKEGSGYGSISVKNSNGSVPKISLSFIGNILNITCSGTYTPGDKYIINIPVNAIEDTAGNGLSTTYASSFTTSKLAVSKIDPANGFDDAPPNQVIKVTFNADITKGSGYNSITVTNNLTKGLVNISKSIYGNTITITNNSPNGLWGNYIYNIYIPADAVKDTAGNELKTAYTSSFTISTA